MGLPFDSKTDIEITSTSSTDIYYFEVEYRWDVKEKEMRVTVDTTLVIEIEHLEVGMVEHIHISKTPIGLIPLTSPTST